MAVPNIFGTATAAIPLSQLDTNFATAITLGNTAVYLGNTTTSLGNVTLTNVTVSSGNVTITGANVSGNLAFTGTGNRITGDFSNATIANRLCLQNSVVNGASIVQAIPNGTGTTSGFSAFNNSDPTNAANIVTFASSTEARVSSGITGTGTYLPMTFFTGGSERARIDTSGNVGIGTSSPSDKLTVISAGTQVGSTNFRNIARIGLATNDASVLLGYDVSAGSAILASTNNYPIAFWTSIAGTYAEKMRIDSSGNVGIGTASPTNKLSVNGNVPSACTGSFVSASSGSIAAGFSDNINSSLYIRPAAGGTVLGTDSGGTIRFATNGNTTAEERMRIDSSGNVGIGTSSPTGKLNVVTDNTHNDGATFDSTGTTQIWMRDTNSTANTKNWGFQISGGDFNILRANDDRATGFVTPVSFAQAPANSLIIDVSGNVGIGTASPSVKLDAVGATGIRVRYDTSGAGISLQQPVASGGDAYLLNQANNAFIFGTNNTERMRIDTSGNVLIGTTAINTISPRLTILGMTAGNQWSCGPTSGNDSFFIYNQSSVGVYLGYGNTSWSSSSDERIKTAIIPFENALEKVCTLRAGTGRYLTDEETVSRSFLIAQDVQAVLPEAVNVLDDEIGTLGLQYTDVIPLLVAAIQEQQALITALTARITALESI
jgi:hypothetical protein